MIEAINQYRTTDGTIFDDEDEAELHEFIYFLDKAKITMFDDQLEKLEGGELCGCDISPCYIVVGDGSQEDIDNVAQMLNEYYGLFSCKELHLLRPNSIYIWGEVMDKKEKWFDISYLRKKAQRELDQLDEIEKACQEVLTDQENSNGNND